MKQYAVHVHLKDVKLIGSPEGDTYWEKTRDGRGMQCVVWGEGVIPVMDIYHRLLRDGYGGLFAIEYTHPAAAVSGPIEHLAHAKSFFRRGELI